MNDDLQHLKLLSIFHYIVAGMMGLIGCFPIIHLVLGIALLSGAIPNKGNSPVPDSAIGGIFVAFASAMIVTFWSLAVCLLLAASYLREHRRYMFCLVTAAVACMFMPFGTVLGVFTIVVLMRPTVKQLFTEGSIAVTSADD
jgi:hypothetical protein